MDLWQVVRWVLFAALLWWLLRLRDTKLAWRTRKERRAVLRAVKLLPLREMVVDRQDHCQYWATRRWATWYVWGVQDDDLWESQRDLDEAEISTIAMTLYVVFPWRTVLRRHVPTGIKYGAGGEVDVIDDGPPSWKDTAKEVRVQARIGHLTPTQEELALLAQRLRRAVAHG